MSNSTSKPLPSALQLIFYPHLNIIYSLSSIKVVVEAVEKLSPIARFADAGLHPIMEKNVRLCGYTIPTPIQAYGIPAILEGHDLLAVAQTGISLSSTQLFGLALMYSE